MGVKGLSKLLKSVCPHVYKEGSLSQFHGSMIAVDASLYICKFVAISTNWMRSFISMIVLLQRFRIKPIFIFDGEAPPEKEWEWQKRNEKRSSVKRRIKDLDTAIKTCFMDDPTDTQVQSALETFNRELKTISKNNKLLEGVTFTDLDEVQMHMSLFTAQKEKISKQDITITPAMIDQLQELLDCFGLPFITAESDDNGLGGEGETLASWLAVHKKVAAVLTDDSDVMVYGTPVYISQLNVNTGECRIVCYNEVLNGLKMTKSEFTDLCIMCGTDYNPNIPGIGPIKSFRLIKEFESIEAIEESGIDTSVLNYKRGRELFSVPNSLTTDIPLIDSVDWDSLRTICGEYNCHVNIEAIKKYWQPAKIEFVL